MATEMNGPRKWKFTYDGGNIDVQGTDFYMDFPANRSGSNVERQYVLREVWEHVDFALAVGMLRRKYIEDRIQTIKAQVGTYGDLLIDEGAAYQMPIEDVMLMDVNLGVIDDNEIFYYDITFGNPLDSTAGGGVEIPRVFEFNEHGEVSCDNLVMYWGRIQRGQYKQLFRASTVFVPSGPGMYQLQLRGVKIKPTWTTETNLEKRQVLEELVETWAARVDEYGELRVDDTTISTRAGFLSVAVEEFATDSVTLTLAFNVGFGI